MGIDIDNITMTNGHVNPPIPRGDAHLLTQRKNPVSRTTTVATYDEQSTIDFTDDKLFPSPADSRHVETALLDEAIDISIMAKGCYDH